MHADGRLTEFVRSREAFQFLKHRGTESTEILGLHSHVTSRRPSFDPDVIID